MKSVVFFVLTVAAIPSFGSSNLPTLPEAGVIKRAYLSGSYSCDEFQEFRPLYLSQAAEEREAPDLQLNFACGSQPMLEGGGTLSLIADIGDVALEDVDSYRARAPEWQVGQSHNFRLQAEVKIGHAYTVILNGNGVQGLLVFKVVAAVPGFVILDYAVRHYHIEGVLEESWVASSVGNVRP